LPRRSVLLVGLLAAASLVAAPSAPADGDPASDFLISQQVFLPIDTHVSDKAAGGLEQLVAASQKAGFPIRVAVIATRYDLGSVPILYRQPQRYAEFLGQELYYLYRHRLLVVMPNGYGVYQRGDASSADRATLARVSVAGTTDGDALVEAAGRAVRALAARRGIQLPAEAAGGSSHSSATTDRILIAVGAAVLAALAWTLVRLRRRRHRRREPAGPAGGGA